MRNKTFYTCIAVIVGIAIAFNVVLRLPYSSPNKNISAMYIKIAEAFKNAEMYDSANFYYSVALNADKENILLNYEIGRNIVKQFWDAEHNDYMDSSLEEAIKRLNAAYDKYPNHLNTIAYLAHAYRLSNNYDKALEYYNMAIQKSYKWDTGYWYASMCYKYKHDYSHAIEYMEKYLDINKTEIDDTYYRLGWLCGKNGEYERAMDYYTKAVNANPRMVRAYINMSYLSELFLEDYENAIRYADKALEINPNSSYAIGNKAYALICLKRYDEALPLVERNMKNGNLRSYFQMGLIQYGKGNLSEARKYLQKSLEEESKNPYDDAEIIIPKIKSILYKCG